MTVINLSGGSFEKNANEIRKQCVSCTYELLILLAINTTNGIGVYVKLLNFDQTTFCHWYT